MTIASVSIVTTNNHLNAVVDASSPTAVVLYYLEHLSLVEGERILLINCATLDDNFAFEDEVEKLLYHAIPELFLEGYEWVEAS